MSYSFFYKHNNPFLLILSSTYNKKSRKCKTEYDFFHKTMQAAI